METPSYVIVGIDAQEAEKTRQAVGALAAVREVVPDFAEAVDAFLQHKPTLVIVYALDKVEAALKAVSALVTSGAQVLVVGGSKDADFILRCMRAGSREFVVNGDEKDLIRALRSLTTAQAGSNRGSIVTVFPAKGGVGATSIATNLAGAIHKLGKRVCLLDLDLHFGDVLSFLDLPGKYSIADVVSNMGRLDRDLLDASVTRHASGIAVLAQSDKIGEAEGPVKNSIEPLLAFLRRHYDWIVIDGVHGFEDVALAALDAADRILVVLTQDVPAVRNAQRCVELFQALEYPEDKTQLVINRYQKHSKITTEVIVESTGLPVAATIANDFGVVIRAINRGVMLFDEAPSSRMTHDINALAAQLAGHKSRTSRQRNFFAELFARKAAVHGAE